MSNPVVELWTAGVGLPNSTVRQARQAEDEGWDGLGVVDSQNLAADPYVEMGLAAAATTTLLLGTAVTNPLTRHPAVTATAIATVHAESGGRAVLGIGRGDSALAHLGLAPAPPSVFARYLERLQGYLRLEDVPFDIATDGGGEIPSSATLELAGGPTASRIRWLRSSLPKVQVDVAATGPKVIALAARLADRITFAVGADLSRVAWAIDTARRARSDAGLDPNALALGAYVPVFVHPDRGTARRMIAGGVASFARFSVMHGQVAGPASESQQTTLHAVHDAYDMHHHFTFGSPQSQGLTDEVIDMFGVAGPATYCQERLAALVELGLSKLYLMTTAGGLDRDEGAAARRRLVDYVLPALR